MSAGLKQQWAAWSAAYAARNKREKVILAVAALAVAYALTDALWLTPSLNAYKAQKKAVQQKTADLADLVRKTQELAEIERAKTAQIDAALKTARTDSTDIASKLAEFERTLVPAQRMPQFLRSLMPATGVEMVALKTVAPVPLVQRAEAKPAEAGKDDKKPAEPATKQPNLYKHGVELTVAGSYTALLDYLTRLENSPQKVLWGRMELRVDKHPRSELKIVLYTLSLDRAWLAV